MMYAALYKYLIQYKELSLPGIGTFMLHRKPATIDFPNKMINPAAYAITLQFPASAPSTGFFAWMAGALNISDREAVMRFNDFAFDLKRKISEGDSIEWNGVGTLNRGLAGEVKFVPAAKEYVFEKPVKAEKVIREKSDHMVRVGEDERTSAEMTELLHGQHEKKSYWWAWALVAGLVAIMFLGWYFSEHGISVEATGNNSKLATQPSPDSQYQLIP